ncbi:hypothetical protein Q5H91_07250 [Sphingomonas sp. KR1UV-12]|uniref:Uncharacterized protein n=1 Tax=Sphingomonas aurea TaxID=3063994 RepID=A0ABT9EJ65_9SPHN|nr:hypothetical protein [Sphingomonas sp. KR1UV-12]MDP1027003.1 hypothetical protein [Sphingomonas sp. KR1UV-12]
MNTTIAATSSSFSYHVIDNSGAVAAAGGAWIDSARGLFTTLAEPKHPCGVLLLECQMPDDRDCALGKQPPVMEGLRSAAETVTSQAKSRLVSPAASRASRNGFA